MQYIPQIVLTYVNFTLASNTDWLHCCCYCLFHCSSYSKCYCSCAYHWHFHYFWSGVHEKGVSVAADVLGAVTAIAACTASAAVTTTAAVTAPVQAHELAQDSWVIVQHAAVGEFTNPGCYMPQCCPAQK